MAKKKFEEELVYRRWEGVPRPLPMKYHPKAVIPCQLTRGDRGPWEYLTADGVRVRLEYRGTYGSTDGVNRFMLENDCQDLYKMPFATIEAAWARRIGHLDGWWNIVRLIKVNA